MSQGGSAEPPIRFGVVGSGWRSEFFLRLARQAPNRRFEVVGVVTRNAERGAEVDARWAVPTFRNAVELVEATGPEFVIASVPWAVTPIATKTLVALGVRVLAETPPAPDLESLRDLWQAVGDTGLVQVGEQYMLMPGHAARRALVREGVIGDAHAAGLDRRRHASGPCHDHCHDRLR